MRYKKAPILEAVLEFRWSEAKALDHLKSLVSLPAFEGFEAPKPRVHIGTKYDPDAGLMSHEQRQVGFEVARRERGEIVFLEEQKFAFVQRAPYDRWDNFSRRALSLVDPAVADLRVEEFSRVGLRFVNRIDIPDVGPPGVNPEEYVTIKFDGPRHDRGIIEEFQMRVVKPTEREGIHYALILATTESPMPDHAAILLDIDVFTRRAISAKGEKLTNMLAEMRVEKNDIFEKCLTDRARSLFGGVEE